MLAKTSDIPTEVTTDAEAQKLELVERKKSLIINTKKKEIANLKLDTLNIYLSISIKILLLMLAIAAYLNWDAVQLLFS